DRCQVCPRSVVSSMCPSAASAQPWLGDTKVADTTAVDGVDGWTGLVFTVVIGLAAVVVVSRRRVVVDVVTWGTGGVVVVLAAGFFELEHPATATMPRTTAATFVLVRPFVFMGVSPSARSPRRRGS